MNLDEAAKCIIDNPEVHDLLTDVLENRPVKNHPHPLQKLVEFQRYEYARNGTTLEKQGFQVGEPWVGDITKARILFLSSNPAFAFNENSPRYFAQTKIFAMPGNKKTPLDLSQVRQNLHDRFQNNPVRGKALHIETLDSSGNIKGSKSVPYWGCVRNNVETLLPVSLKGNPKPLTDYVRKLMSYAVCMEVVPFKSNRETGVHDAMSECWDKYTRHILERAAAPVFILVGLMARKAFLEYALKDNAPEKCKARQAFDNRDIYLYRDNGGTIRATVYVTFAQGQISRFEKYFLPQTLGMLTNKIQKPVLNPPVIN
jgi:hypothetical protein